MRGSVSHEKVGGNEAEVCEIQIMYDNPENLELLVELPLEDYKFTSLLEHDLKFGIFMTKYFVENNFLLRSIVDNGHIFEARVIPKLLVDVVLHLGHNQSGHYGYKRTYTAIKCLYYWKGMRVKILQYCKSCKVCATI